MLPLLALSVEHATIGCAGHGAPDIGACLGFSSYTTEKEAAAWKSTCTKAIESKG